MARLRIEVVYALGEAQDLLVLEMEQGANAGEAIEASGMARRHRLAAADLALAIFGKRIEPQQGLRAGDRIEILRPLAADPKEARRLRARGRRQQSRRR